MPSPNNGFPVVILLILIYFVKEIVFPVLRFEVGEGREGEVRGVREREERGREDGGERGGRGEREAGNTLGRGNRFLKSAT